MLAENHGGAWTLKTGDTLLPLNLKETASLYMTVVIDRLKDVTEEDWNVVQLHQILASILNDVGPHAKMVNSALPSRQVDFHLF